ncbi:long-chain fatty acid--CoA ligase [Amycolatopsis sp. K13G38]|uniref:Long-chain fatty acid--CoA ligase n=1 Tax=Amycolatopsis acididurans TaxID=2724524 RepID=A0ABX1JI42_9PSEU|nr:AMP-binding protein [Amycolatopsis acididurans]NKQ58261.1 long-chain fatty acid--CoA ligase [Amycolatopsis acididurans]
MGESSLFLTRILDVLCEGGDKIAFAYRGQSMSYQETFDTLRRLHATLKSEGISPGQTVAITGGNAPETILLQIAAQLRGAEVVHVDGCAFDEVAPDHVLSSDPDCPLLLASNGAKAAEADIVMPRGVKTLFLSDDAKPVTYRDEYEDLARTCEPHPDGPQQVLLIAPMSHPIGNRITVKALLAGDTVVIHEHAAEALQSETATPSAR